ncbi:DUF6597 domain-containing transcriptional factor [Spirosoma taeanense]|uniref:DUF6597 domain-containing transcriptional factor n=1 Tax=Spirosoma taeanense TaxID=2735870 RepID=UPI001F0445BA|nr:DUF6597 domain-containing transcriptional factor [Spirosoma taeanense]
MRYQKFAPAPHLAPFVECYFIWEKRDQLTAPLRIESPPSGFGSMVFNLGDAYRVRTARTDQIAPNAFLTGQATSRYELELTGRINMAGIVFRPAGLNSLFGLPMYEFTDERICLFDVLKPLVGSLPDQLAEAQTDAERVALLEGFVSRQFLRRGNQADRTDYTANLIADRQGLLNINELMDDLYVCRRQFERQFLFKVGISPKYYARIRRVGILCAQMAAQRWQVTDWHELIYQFGY